MRLNSSFLANNQQILPVSQPSLSNEKISPFLRLRPDSATTKPEDKLTSWRSLGQLSSTAATLSRFALPSQHGLSHDRIPSNRDGHQFHTPFGLLQARQKAEVCTWHDLHP